MAASLIQEISAFIGRTTGKGLAGNIRDYCPRWMAYSMVLAVFLANAISIEADIAAMGRAIRLLIGGVASMVLKRPTWVS